MTEVLKKVCFYSEDFSFDYSHHHGGWVLTYYTINGDESSILISKDDIDSFMDFLEAIHKEGIR